MQNFFITKVGMVHGLLGRESIGMVVSQQFVEEVEGLGRDQMLILAVHEALPALLRVTAQDVVEARVELDVILFNVLEQLVCAEHLGDSHKLKTRTKFMFFLEFTPAFVLI
jgi:hypothetical protein